MTSSCPAVILSREVAYQLPVQLMLHFLCRTIILKISIIGILCYYWLNVVAVSESQVKFQKYLSLTYSTSLRATLMAGLFKQREVPVVPWTAEFATLIFLYLNF